MGEKQSLQFSSDSLSRVGILRLDWKLLVSTLVFTLCISPTLVSYAPYSFSWDDSDYLWRSIAVTRAFWNGNFHDMRTAMVSIRPPIMTFLGLPWGPLASWDAAGKCFITLNVITALFVACCLFLLLRVGLKPLYLVIASASVLAAIGPYPAGSDAHFYATGFLADSLFAWIAFAATLLIPYEATTCSSSTADGLVRGVFWATIFLTGAMTKVSFFYFIVLIVPALCAIRMRHSGLRSAFVALISLAVCSVPAAIYYLRYGPTALKNGFAASFGHDAPLYYVPLSRFLRETVQQSPGFLLGVVTTATGIVYLVLKRRDVAWSKNALPILIMAGYCTISLASTNREIRFLFPGIIALPFLIGILSSVNTTAFPSGSATIAAILVFCCLVVAGMPTLHRANRQSIHLSEAVLAQAIESNAHHIVLATDSPSLNFSLMRVAIEASSRPSVEAYSLAWRAISGTPIEDDFRTIDQSDLVVFQNSEALDPPFTNQRVPEYEQYTRQHLGNVPIKIVDGIRIYGRH
ncbi:MAG: hypothetical protein WBR26_00345 [Candidatus Acidiferrum sp.]